MKSVILSGGGGTRLFPISRESFPKQFIRLSGQESLIEKTYKRALLISSPEDVAVSTSERYELLTVDRLGSGIRLIIEPEPRNTTGAILFAVKYACETFGWDEEEVFAFMPSDHEISPNEAFRETLLKAERIAQEGFIVVIGIRPDHPATGYGYIRIGEPLPEGYRVERFVEKPSEERAREMLEEGNYLWNSGIYVGKAKTFLEELKRCAPEFAPFVDMDLEELKENFSKLPSMAIDYSLAERSSKMAVVPAGFNWSDVGSWDALSELLPKDEKGNSVAAKDAVIMDAKNTTIIARKTIPIVIGTEDLIVVEDSDVLLVAKKGTTQKVKEAVAILKSKGRKEAVEHKRVHRPWGYYEVLLTGDRFKVKKIHVLPGKRLSLQMHHHRSEHWVVVKGTAKITVGEKTFFLHENESTYVPKSTLHRIENVGKIPLEIVEIQAGEYVEEDDIIRVEDDWERK